VQGTLEHAVQLVYRLPERAALTVAGRTDTGVHARHQVAHVDLPAGAWEARPHPLRAFARLLPPDIRVGRAERAPDGFDARFSGLTRRYAYRVHDGETGPDPLRRRDVLWHRRDLSTDRMNDAAQALLGLQDFAAFCRFREGGSTVRELLRLGWARDEGGLAVATVEADAFCHSMVRALVGSLLPVGDGRRPPTWPARLLAARVRDPLVQVAPPHGLTLEEVRYPPDDELAARVEITRNPRGDHWREQGGS
jgi:tRNA pseudouridine38-40 synthase